MDVPIWLRGLGLEQYEAEPENLKDLDVTLVGDRRRLLDAIDALAPRRRRPTG